jgi:hypothetical protein
MLTDIANEAATGKLVYLNLKIEERARKVYRGYEKMLIDVCTVICLVSDILLLCSIEVDGLSTHIDQFYF